MKLPIPPLMVRLPAVSGLLNVPVPLWIVRLPLTMLFAVLKVALPPVKSSGPVARYAPRMSVIPPAKRNTPLPATLEAVVSVDSVETPPANSSVPPAPIVKLPLLVPPPARLSVPLWMSTVPLLLKVTPEIDVVVPAPVLTNVPAFRNVASPPNTFAIPASLTASNRPVLLNTAPCEMLRVPVSAKRVVHSLVSVRPWRSLSPEVVRSIAPLTRSGPVPEI